MKKIKRTEAAAIIEHIRDLCFRERTGGFHPPPLWLNEEIEKVFAAYDIPPFRKCNGEAHSNPIGYDHCMVCMPRWGVVGEAVKVS